VIQPQHFSTVIQKPATAETIAETIAEINRRGLRADYIAREFNTGASKSLPNL
jgi:hypothetical protein